MLKLITSLSLVFSMASFATAHSFTDLSVAEAVQTGSCEMIVQNKPILLSAGEQGAELGVDEGDVLIWAHNLNAHMDRQLDVGRVLRIRKSDDFYVYFDDSNIELIRLDRNPALVKVSEVESVTKNNLRMICNDKKPISF